MLRCFPKPNTISWRDYQLILCKLEFLHQLQGKIRKLIPKGRSVIITYHLWELACELQVVIMQVSKQACKLLVITHRNRAWFRKAAKNRAFWLSRLPRSAPNFSKV